MTPVDEVEMLSKTIARLVADKGLQKQLVENGHRRYLAEFTKENTVRAYLGLYHALLARPSQI